MTVAPEPAARHVHVPDTLEEVLSPAWLSQALGQRFPGVKVTTVTRGPVVSRVSTNARFHLECEGALPAGLPPDLCVKGYFTDWSETAALSRTAGEPEAWFYRDLASAAGVRTLRCVYADVDPVTRHGLVITEDVAPAGATFLDALSDYTPDQAAASLEQYAVLHGRTWEWDDLDRPWLAPRVESTLKVRGLREIRGNFEGPIGSRVPEVVRDAERLVDAIGRLGGDLERARPRACSTATPTSEISTSTHRGSRAWSTGNWSRAARGTSTSATTSRPPSASRTAGGASVTSSRTTWTASRRRVARYRRGTRPGGASGWGCSTGSSCGRSR